MEKVICFVKPPDKTPSRTYNAGFVLHVSGEIAKVELRSQGECLGDWLIDDLTPDGFTGLLIWEGECLNSDRRNVDDFEPHLRGTWRKPTAKELWALRNGPAA